MEIAQLIMHLFSDQNTIARIALVILIAFYGLFALIVAIQINNLNRVINQIGFAAIFNLLAFLHLSGALALLVFTVLFL